jgi:hypothetical protein
MLRGLLYFLGQGARDLRVALMVLARRRGGRIATFIRCIKYYHIEVTMKKTTARRRAFEGLAYLPAPRTVQDHGAAGREADAHQRAELSNERRAAARRVPSHGTGGARVREEQVPDLRTAKLEGKGNQGVHGGR